MEITKGNLKEVLEIWAEYCKVSDFQENHPSWDDEDISDWADMVTEYLFEQLEKVTEQ